MLRVAEALERRVEEIAGDMTREMGKPLRESRAEVARGAATLRVSAAEGWQPQGQIYQQAAAGNPIYVIRRPLGVVGLITPWNFPLAIPLWKAAPALAHGNTVVLKPAQEAPLTGLHIAACFDEAEAPAGIFNVVVGSGADTGRTLIEDPRVRAVSFTGSAEVGRRVRDMATAHDKRVQLELGGHSPLIVLADADLEKAAESAFAGAFWAAGQKCTATRRIYVHDSVYESFRNMLLERMDKAVVGDPSDPTTEVGPLINQKQLREVLEAIERARREGATLLCGGEFLGNGGCLITPALFEDVRDDAFLSCEEVFGPVASLYRVTGLDDAIERANQTRYGLSASIFTNDNTAIQRFAAEVEAGVLRINAATAGGEPHVPFGGVKASGYGPHEQGRAAAEFYSETVTVYHNSQ
jgi:aldehyde dehydrogenase (NAD+)